MHVWYSLCLSWHLCALNSVFCFSILSSDRVKTQVWHKMDCTQVNFHVLHASCILCAGRKYNILCAINSKKHVSNTLCATRKSLFLWVNSHLLPDKDQGIACQRNVIENVGKNSVKYLRTLFQSTLDDILSNQEAFDPKNPVQDYRILRGL